LAFIQRTEVIVAPRCFGTHETRSNQPETNRNQGSTRNFTLLFSVLVGVITVTKPVVAPVGTLASISECDTTLNAAAVPLKLTQVAPVRSVPRILMPTPTSPDVGSVSTNGPRPTERPNTVPQPAMQAGLLGPPTKVPPAKKPVGALT